jgi:hypothetical protein
VLDHEPQATATRCAEATGESVASCSYHLRILAKYGYVEAVAGAGRERPWRLTARRQDLSAPGPTAEERLASRAATEAFLEHEFERLRAWRARVDAEPAEWVDACGLGGSTTYLTAAELAGLRDELLGAVTRHRERDEPGAERPADARPVRLFFAATVGPGG